jgi:flagellar operon protein
VKELSNMGNPYINDPSVNKVSDLGKPNGASKAPDGKLQGPSFEDQLSDILGGKVKGAEAQIGGKSAVEGLKFSNHAIERMRDRGITLKPEDMVKLNDAVEKAAKKGSKESLMLLGDNALIVSIKNKTIVTAMDKDSMKDKVFSNIDSTMIL